MVLFPYEDNLCVFTTSLGESFGLLQRSFFNVVSSDSLIVRFWGFVFRSLNNIHAFFLDSYCPTTALDIIALVPSSPVKEKLSVDSKGNKYSYCIRRRLNASL